MRLAFRKMRMMQVFRVRSCNRTKLNSILLDSEQKGQKGMQIPVFVLRICYKVCKIWIRHVVNIFDNIYPRFDDLTKPKYVILYSDIQSVRGICPVVRTTQVVIQFMSSLL